MITFQVKTSNSTIVNDSFNLNLFPYLLMLNPNLNGTHTYVIGNFEKRVRIRHGLDDYFFPADRFFEWPLYIFFFYKD